MSGGVAPEWMNTETPEFVREIQHHMTTLDDVAALGAKEQGLAIVSTLRSDGTIQSSLVNAGVLPDPLRGDEDLGVCFRVERADDSQVIGGVARENNQARSG